MIAAVLASGAASAQTAAPAPDAAVSGQPDTAATTQSTTPAKPAAVGTDPYEALGIRAGGFILYPALTITGGYTNNASASAGGRPSGFTTVAPELVIQSDWDRHAATLTLRGAYEKFSDDATADAPTASAKGTVRLDLADDWQADFDAGIDYRQDSLTDPAYPNGFDDPSPVKEYTSSVSVSGGPGRTKFTLGANLDRSVYGESAYSGAPVDQSERNNTIIGGRVRVGYEASGTLTPFVEADLSRRTFDQTLDDNGYERSGNAIAGKVGVEFDHGPLLTGEASVGMAQESFDDDRLAALKALTFDGSLIWSPSELSTVTFDTTTTLNPSVDPASSGSVKHDNTVEVAYAWRQNVTFNATAGLTTERFQGTDEVDRTYDLGAGLTWKLNRNLQINAGYVHEWLVSSDATTNYTSDTVKVELRAQR